jgi:hypothetical protein
MGHDAESNVKPSLLFAAVLIAIPLSAFAAERPPVDFNREVRPILSNRCFLCHGPDEGERQGGLRLDVRESALEANDSGAVAIVPGEPDASELLVRVAAEDDSLRMPPEGHGEALTKEEVETLRRWIAEGAKYARHWAYEPPVRPTPPEVDHPAWSRSAIDRFVLARMKQEGLEPSPPADKYALIRRVSLDLTGLPPTVEEVDAFVADDDPLAYERLVDRLLASEAYGERWAKDWLDLARYADSAGYADDRGREIWAFRDWVIRSLNANKPFDEFTIEQLAGDLLPGATQDQRIATAFHRNTMTNSEGGTDDEEFRNVAVVDRVNTTFAVWMGTTMACAQCHTHKYDPLTHHDYFRFFAILNQSADADRPNEEPLLTAFTGDQTKQKLAWEAEAAELRPKLALTDEMRPAYDAWRAKFAKAGGWAAWAPASVSSKEGVSFDVDGEGKILAKKSAGEDDYAVALSRERLADPAQPIRALRIETFPHASLPGGGTGFGGGNFVVTAVEAFVRKTGAEIAADAAPIPWATTKSDYDQSGFPAASLMQAKESRPGWAIAGQVDKPHELLLVPIEPIALAEGEELFVRIEQQSPHANHTLGHFRLSATTDEGYAEASKLPKELADLLGKPYEELNEEQRRTLETRYAATTAPELAILRDRLAQVEKSLTDLKPGISVPIMQELPEAKRRETFVQLRGAFNVKGDKVEPGLPEVFPQPPEGTAPDRLAMAKWLVSEENPLTARVTANRYWESLFGVGIVPTSEEFGSQGDPPTHPQLLDWLATELVRLDWDMKAFLKQLVMSETYRQASTATEEKLALDPDSRWLARGPRQRLAAEAVRDQALFAAGLLSRKMFGPPVRPPQPTTGLNAAFGGQIDWTTSAGEDRYRRGLYVQWRRSNPYPSMASFDAPTREVCTLKRVPTNTPLQALVTLNDPVYVEAAQALARRIIKEATTDADRAVRGFRLVVSRPPSDAERDAIVALYQDAKANLDGKPEEATKLATDPLGPLPEGMDPVELGAWTTVGNVLLNLDEALMKR